MSLIKRTTGCEQILAPVSTDSFFADYWEKQPMHIERADAKHFANLVSRQSIETLLATRALYFPDVQLVNAANAIDVADYTGNNRRVAVPQLMRNFSAGATLVVSGVHEQFAAIADMCRALSAGFQMRSQANLYLTPRGGQGFKAHYDTHDVFILQIEGRKTFRLYESEVELPFTDDSFDSQSFEAGPLQEEVSLSAGDTLYIPRGVVHDAIANEDDESLHLTVGVFPMVVRDLLHEVIQVVAERQVPLRGSVGLSSSSPVKNDGFSEVLGNLESLLGADANATVEEAKRRLLSEVSTGSSTGTHGALAAPVHSDSQVVANHDVVLHLERNADSVTLWLTGQVLDFQEPLSSAVIELFGTTTGGDPVRVAELGGLNADQQLVLCQQLVASGALRVV